MRPHVLFAAIRDSPGRSAERSPIHLLLTTLVFPVLYLLIFRPMRREIRWREEVERTLRDTRDRLRQAVRARDTLFGGGGPRDAVLSAGARIAALPGPGGRGFSFRFEFPTASSSG